MTNLNSTIAALTEFDGLSSPDAELVSAAERVLHRAIRLHQHDEGQLPIGDGEYEAEESLVIDEGKLLIDMHPVTKAGLLAKARFVRVQFERTAACDRGETVESMGEYHERLAWSLINDLLEMNGGLDGLPTFTRCR